MNFNLNKLLIIAGTAALILVVIFIFWWNNEIDITGVIKVGADDPVKTSSIAGIECDNSSRRPIAVMLAGDAETRPLSGISQADMVFEMPVAPNGITRFMAVFQCQEPAEIGSVRSSREDFIPLAAGLKAIYAHWGGEKEALKKLDAGILNNIDGLKYEGTVFYRKKNIARPHNGFTTLALILDKAKSLEYSLSDIFEGYPRGEEEVKRSLSNIAESIDVGYEHPFGVQWTYNNQTKTYFRNRSGTPEKDRNSSEAVVDAKVVIVMRTTSRVLNKDYISVVVSGQGDATIYQNGVSVNGTWKKDPVKVDGKLYFYDESGNEIKLAPGKIWVQITTN